MAFFEVDRTRCAKDNICIRVCVANIIKTDPESGFPVADERKSKRCIACGHCVAFCPHDACSVQTLDKDEFIDVRPEEIPAAAETDALLRSRRSIRHYRKEELSRETLSELIDVASTAPTSENAQNLRWTVVMDRVSMRKIGDRMAEICLAHPKSGNKHEYAVIQAMAKAYHNGNDVFLRGAPNMAVALTPEGYEWLEDGAISLTYLELAAHARKLGACWAGYFVQMARQDAELRKLAGIGDDWHVAGALLLGKPLFKKVKKLPPRKKRAISWIQADPAPAALL